MPVHYGLKFGDLLNNYWEIQDSLETTIRLTAATLTTIGTGWFTIPLLTISGGLVGGFTLGSTGFIMSEVKNSLERILEKSKDNLK